jgi:hypothetical protein
MKRIRDGHGDPDVYELSSGRRFTANCGVIGLNSSWGEHEDCWEPTGGFDGCIPCSPSREKDPWTAAERVELADYMIALWMKWRDEQ